MKISVSHIEKIRKELVTLAKAKQERIEYFQNGGSVDEFKPKSVKVARPF